MSVPGFSFSSSGVLRDFFVELSFSCPVGQVLSNADIVNDVFCEMLCAIDINFANDSLASKQARSSNLVKTRWFPPDRSKAACKRDGLIHVEGTGQNCMSSSLSLARSRLVLPGCSRNHVIAGRQPIVIQNWESKCLQVS